MLLSTMYPIMYLPPSKVISHQLAIAESRTLFLNASQKGPFHRVGVKLMAGLHEMLLYFKHITTRRAALLRSRSIITRVEYLCPGNEYL